MNLVFYNLLSKFSQQTWPSRAWVPFGPLEVYLRVSKRLHSSEGASTMLDIATITVREFEARANLKAKFPKYRGTLGAAFAIFELFEAASILPIRVYVENVLEPKLAAFLVRRKWYKIPNVHDPRDLAPCFYSRN